MASAASSSVDGKPPPTKRLKLELPDDHAAVAPGTEHVAVAPGTEHTSAAGLSLAHVQNWVKHRWEQIVQDHEHPMQYLRHALKTKEAKKRILQVCLNTHVDSSSRYEVNMHEQGCLGRCHPD